MSKIIYSIILLMFSMLSYADPPGGIESHEPQESIHADIQIQCAECEMEVVSLHVCKVALYPHNYKHERLASNKLKRQRASAYSLIDPGRLSA